MRLGEDRVKEARERGARAQARVEEAANKVERQRLRAEAVHDEAREWGEANNRTGPARHVQDLEHQVKGGHTSHSDALP